MIDDNSLAWEKLLLCVVFSDLAGYICMSSTCLLTLLVSQWVVIVVERLLFVVCKLLTLSIYIFTAKPIFRVAEILISVKVEGL